MKYLNKLAFVFIMAAFGMLTMTSCEGGDLYNVNAPDWISDAIGGDSGEAEEPEELEGMEEDVYSVGAADFSTGWWAAFSKYYQVPEGAVWNAVFNLSINPSASNTYKNFAMIICNDEDRGAADYKEYGAIRYDNQPSGNSEWGDYIDRSLVTSTLTFGSDTDAGVEKLGGRIVLTVDRSEGGLVVKMTNGTVTKTYTQKSALVNLNADASNNTIRCFLVPEGSCINFLQSNIEPIGGFTSAEDKQPLSMVLKGVPRKVLQGAGMEAFANVTAEVQFEQEVSMTVSAEDLTFEAIPDMAQLGTKTLVVAYNKTYKGENADKPILAYASFDVVDKMFTSIGATDNSTPFWGAHSDYIKVEAGETFISTFTNYTSGAANWNNFVVVLANQDGSTEYGVLRADNYGWGNGYEACTAIGDQGDWATWLAAMDGAKVTTYITNNGDGTADVKAVMQGTDGNTYTQEYIGINTVNPDDFYFHYTVDGSHLEFDDVLGEEDNSTGWWAAHSPYIQVPAGKTYSTRFKNYTSGAANWNNFLVVLTNQDGSAEYAVLRADNYGWGAAYDGNPNLTTFCDAQEDWAGWLAAMDDAMVTVTVVNHGTSADVKAVMVGNNGKTYTQEYNGLSPIDGGDFYMHFTVEGGHLVFE